jgi:O-antigen ligase
MKPLWRDRIIMVFAAALALGLGVQVAEEAWVAPVAVAALAAAFILVRLVGQPIDTIALGFLLAGYILGNRGFAQLMPIPGLPLLPAETGLALTAVCLVWRCVRERRLPWSREPLDLILLAWLLLGTVRVVLDAPRFGFVAVRDYAMVYYAAFFFIAREASRNTRSHRFLQRCVLGASALLPLVFVLFELLPDFFLNTLLVRGSPLVFFKGDLVTTFLGVGGVLLFLAAPPRWRAGARALAVTMIMLVLVSDARASTLGVIVALGWVAVSRFRRFAWVQVGVATLGLLLLGGFAACSDNAWAAQKTRGIVERAMTVVDFRSGFDYREAHSVSKSENNQFRWVWWRTVTGETFAQNPVFGLGFGYDLARGFLQTYNPEMADEFSARSPHNILVTILGRLGLAGLLIFLVFLGLLAARTWRVVRAPESDATQVAQWIALWPIVVSACFGVVLEGPMGAVLFWTLLGIAVREGRAKATPAA